MEQLPLFSNLSLTVSELTRYLRQLLESDEVLQDVWVYGEISNLTRHTSGHIYFTLKDSGASLKAVIWKTLAERIRLPIQNGMAVEAHGSIGIYEPRGEYQLYVKAVRAAGEGYLYQEFLRLKTRLEMEGWFDEARKRPLPDLPNRIGIVTSPTGAALQDMLNTLRNRYRLAEIILAPASVQGSEAPAEIVNAIRLLNENAHPDVILVARGGGSLEDLWAFNDERVVKAIASSKAPVISGIGHETDFTLADFAADRRAPTPTGAAVMATPNSADLKTSLHGLQNRLNAAFEENIHFDRQRLNQVRVQLVRNSPLWRVQNNRQRLDELSARCQRSYNNNLALRHTHFNGICKHLESLNPLAILRRGYAMVSDDKGRLVQSTAQVEVDSKIQVRFTDGELKAKVTQKMTDL